MTRTALYPSFYWGDLRLDDYPYSFEFGADLGDPESVMEVVTSLVEDGDIMVAAKDNNRELSFAVIVEGADLARVAEAEAALRRECLRPTNTLTIDPGDGFGPATVFETYAGSMVLERDDEHEQHGIRRWRVTLPAAPHVRSQNLTTVSALRAGTGGSALIDDCSSAEGWTGKRNNSASTPSTLWEAGAVGIVDLDNLATSPEVWMLTRTGTLDLTAMSYLVVQARTVSPIEDFITATVARPGLAVSRAPLSMSATSDPGWFEYVYALPDEVWDSVTFRHVSAPNETWQGLLVRSLIQRDTPSGLARQQTRFLEVGGTERTPASLRVSASDEGSMLGLTIVHTSPDDGTGYAPDLRRWRTGGNTVTTDGNTFSGARETLSPNFVTHDIPIASLADGGYQLMMYARCSVAATVPVEATIQSVQGGTVLGESTWSGDVTFSANQWQLVPMGLHAVPLVAAKSGVYRIAFRALTGAGTVEYDEAWLFAMGDESALTITEVSTPFLWMDSADTSSRVPRIWQGNDPNRHDARFPDYLYCPGHHTFRAGWMRVYTAARRVDWAGVDLTYYKRWHTHAAED